ncbi:methyltransferase domain-containing protein [Shewanella halifaxensis]|uniref:methyltransferase domain-containing protein n=1 Tax=Shewanella halifaxensis TaxID=271098 RepID=UPI000D59CFD3|nr:methyltransferase domain-containing protein [Shewanella halifaxensis]
MNKGSNGLKQQLATNFSAAANNYHSYDVLQQESAKHLLAQMSACEHLLDIGAGPGTCFGHIEGLKQVTSLDIAPGMLRQLITNFPSYLAVCGDAQNLPLVAASVDGIYSNVALQWCDNLALAIAEANRVLKVAGELNVSIVSQDSLFQLRELGFKINQFIAPSNIQACFDDEHWDIELCDTQAITVHFDDLKAMLQSIKGVGAGIVTRTSSTNLPQVTLRGRKDWQALQAKAELNRAPEGLPLTYNISFIKARKKR